MIILWILCILGVLATVPVESTTSARSPGWIIWESHQPRSPAVCMAAGHTDSYDNNTCWNGQYEDAQGNPTLYYSGSEVCLPNGTFRVSYYSDNACQTVARFLDFSSGQCSYDEVISIHFVARCFSEPPPGASNVRIDYYSDQSCQQPHSEQPLDWILSGFCRFETEEEDGSTMSFKVSVTDNRFYRLGYNSRDCSGEPFSPDSVDEGPGDEVVGFEWPQTEYTFTNLDGYPLGNCFYHSPVGAYAYINEPSLSQATYLRPSPSQATYLRLHISGYIALAISGYISLSQATD